MTVWPDTASISRSSPSRDVTINFGMLLDFPLQSLPVINGEDGAGDFRAGIG